MFRSFGRRRRLEFVRLDKFVELAAEVKQLLVTEWMAEIAVMAMKLETTVSVQMAAVAVAVVAVAVDQSTERTAVHKAANFVECKVEAEKSEQQQV